MEGLVRHHLCIDGAVIASVTIGDAVLMPEHVIINGAEGSLKGEFHCLAFLLVSFYVSILAYHGPKVKTI